MLPPDPDVKLVTGPTLYSYGGKTYPPKRDTGPAPQCRIEVSPTRQRAVDYFLHVLTVTDAGVASVEKAIAQVKDQEVTVVIGEIKITFEMTEVAGHIELSGRRTKFTHGFIFE